MSEQPQPEYCDLCDEFHVYGTVCRYSPVIEGSCSNHSCEASMEGDAEGGWVRYEDAAKLLVRSLAGTGGVSWRDSWHADSEAIVPLEGRRGVGERAGEIGLATFPAGEYPACSNHGAMLRVSTANDFWRCLVEGCNVGAEWLR